MAGKKQFSNKSVPGQKLDCNPLGLRQHRAPQGMNSNPNRVLVILILGALSTISPMSIDMYLPAFPQMAAAFHTSPAKVSLSLSTYFIGLAVGQLIYGPLLDRFGRKLPLYAGLMLFFVMSFACMFAPNMETLLAFRCVQALGGCAAAVASMAMVRDFFPAKDAAKIISLLILILGVSPMLAPTIGTYVALAWGWRYVFVVLAMLVLIVQTAVFFLLPEKHQPDPTISLHPWPIVKNYIHVLREPEFYTYTFAGAFSFAGVLVYVAGSPIIFMDSFHVTTRQYGMIFAGLSVGFIGSNQVNIWLLKHFTSAQIFKAAIIIECICSMIFLAGTYLGWFGLATTLVFLFVLLSCLGLTYPNAAAMALSPFDKNIGSASAMLGFVQIGVAALTSSCVGLFNSKTIMPVIIIFMISAWIALAIFMIGRKRLPVVPHLAVGETPAGPH